MNSVRDEIAALEERLRSAELGPDPRVFEELLADDAIPSVRLGHLRRYGRLRGRA